MGDVISATASTTPPPGVNAPAVEQKVERPAWLPEKFKTPEDMAKSYAEAEKKISELTKPPAAAKVETPVVPTVVPGTPTEADLAKVGLDMKALEAEYAANGGKLTPESLKKLNDAGITQAHIDDAVRGRLAKAEDFEKAIVKDIKGGKEALLEAVKWADAEAKRGTLTQAEVDAFNAAMDSGNPAMGALAAEGLISKFKRAQGPVLIDGQAPTDRAIGYESRAQQLADMKDPRYKSDPAFRDQVLKKSVNSKF